MEKKLKFDDLVEKILEEEEFKEIIRKTKANDWKNNPALRRFFLIHHKDVKLSEKKEKVSRLLKVFDE